jgi:cell division septation protein DedD
MTPTSDDDGTTPVDPGDAFPVSPAYGSRALGEADHDDTAPIVGLPLVPPPPTPGDVALQDVALQASADEHPTVALAGGAAGAAYVSDDVLPAGPVGRSHRAAKEPESSGPREPRLPRTGPTPLGRVVLPLILALVSGVAIVAGWVHLEDDRAASAVATPTASASATPTPSTSTSATPTVSESPSSAVSSSPAVVASSPAASPTTSSTATAVDRSVPVVVLNSTKRTGLAAKVAAQLRKEGWTVVLVGNFRGTLAITTVYAEGNADAVATMQADLPTKDRQKPPFGAMNPKRLTVVIGADYPRS